MKNDTIDFWRAALQMKLIYDWWILEHKYNTVFLVFFYCEAALKQFELYKAINKYMWLIYP